MKYTFKEMLDDAKRAGLTSDKVMMRSVESMSELLCLVKEEHPELYWKFMREQHGIMYGNHYNEAFAMFDVGMMRYIDRDGKKCEGTHWTAEQIEASTRMMGFPAGTTKWDKYVAFNAFYSDLCTVYNDEQIIKGGGRKINCVMRCSRLNSSVGDRPAPRGGTTRPDERKVTTI